MSEEIYLEKKTGYAIMTINRPKQMNALNTGIVEQIDKLLDEVEADPSIRCLIITGAGEKSFIAGADIGQMGTPGYQPADAHYLITCGYKVYNRVEGLKIPTIAAINGYCLGGGLELAMCCDFRICSANARFALPEIALGIIPGWGGTIRLPRIIGYFLYLVKEVFLSAWATIKLVWSPKLVVEPEITSFHTHVRTLPGKVVLANSITMTPGTITVDMHDDLFLIHCLDTSFDVGKEGFEMERRVMAVEGTPKAKKSKKGAKKA